MTLRILAPVLLALLLGAGGGWYWYSHRAGEAAGGPSAVIDGVVQDASGRRVLYWHDPMVPGPKFDTPGKSPFMDMQLMPQYADEAAANGVSISPAVVQNLGIRLAKAEPTSLGTALTAVGRIEPDEHRIQAVQIRVPGFVERLYVRAVGDTVRPGQKLADIYAPELLAAQEEYLALHQLEGVADVASLREAARTRLKLLGMRDAEITAVAKSGRTNPRVGVYAPAAGVVQELGVREGGQTMPGTNLMQLADLSSVWLIAEVPARHAARVQVGEPVQARVEGLSGQSLEGRVEYLYPTLDRETRTLRIRVALSNPQGKLRPGMYASLRLAGQQREALTVPSEAVIATGTRQLVIVKEGDIFRPAEVETGSSLGERTEILKGLEAGETVVASGQFLIDSEASLKGVLARLSAAPAPSEASAGPPAPAQAATAHPTVRGKIVALTPAAGEVTLDHEPVPALSWPAMTMGFKMREPSQLQGLEVGDAVRFQLNLTPQDGSYVIEQIQREDSRP